MLLSTLENIDGYRVAEHLGLVESTSRIPVTKGLLQSLLNRSRNEHAEAIEDLSASAPAGANAIIGLRVSTATHQMPEGAVLFITYLGTAVRVVPLSPD